MGLIQLHKKLSNKLLNVELLVFLNSISYTKLQFTIAFIIIKMQIHETFLLS